MASTRVTIQDLADKLGLSKFSVSRALSGKPGVAEATRGRVLRAAHAMGYRVNAEIAHSVGQILFVRQEIDMVSSEMWLNVQHGAEAEAERLGYSVVPRQARFIEAERLDPAVVGMILAVPRSSAITEMAARTGLPVACAAYPEPMSRFDHAVCADWEAGMMVARLLGGLGHREVAFVHGSTLPTGRGERYRGFRDGMLDFADARVDDIVFDELQGFRRAFLNHVKDGGAPTALFCAHDGIAVSAISELLRMGIRIPEDISVVGADFPQADHGARPSPGDRRGHGANHCGPLDQPRRGGAAAAKTEPAVGTGATRIDRQGPAGALVAAAAGGVRVHRRFTSEL